MARKRPTRRIGAPAPRAIEASLYRALLPMIRSVRATLPQIKTKAHAAALGRSLKREWSDARIKKIVRTIGKKGELAGSVPWKRGRKDAATYRTDAAEYDAEKLVTSWAAEAAKLITSVRDEVAESLAVDIAAAAMAGTPPSELASKWARQGIPVKFGTLEGRTKVIAQNQTARLHAEVQKTRAGAFGIREFVWRSQGDDRVRDAHKERDGKIFRYKEPGSEGLPGTPVGCRCWAESVIPDDFEF